MIKAGREQVVSLIDINLSRAKSTTEQVELIFEDANGETITAWQSFHQNSAKITFDVLRVLGWDVNERNWEIEQLRSIETCGLAGNKCKIDVGEETYSGRTSLKVKSIYAVDAQSSTQRRVIETMSQQEASGFAEGLRSRLRGTSTPTAATTWAPPDAKMPF